MVCASRCHIDVVRGSIILIFDDGLALARTIAAATPTPCGRRAAGQPVGGGRRRGVAAGAGARATGPARQPQPEGSGRGLPRRPAAPLHAVTVPLRHGSGGNGIASIQVRRASPRVWTGVRRVGIPMGQQAGTARSILSSCGICRGNSRPRREMPDERRLRPGTAPASRPPSPTISSYAASGSPASAYTGCGWR